MQKNAFAYLEIIIVISFLIFSALIVINQTKILTGISNLKSLNNNKTSTGINDISENPKELRDLKRITDLKKIKQAISLYLTDSDVIKPNLDGDFKNNLCKDHIWYSIPKSFSNGCPKNKICIYPERLEKATQTNGKGWIPINFNIASSVLITKLPLDPINSPPYYYTYACNEKEGTFELNTKLESKFYKDTLNEDETDGGNATELFEVGTAPGLNILGNEKNSFFLLNSSKFWKTKASLPTARSGLSASSLFGKIYAIGGYNGSGLGYLQTNEVYDPKTDTWQKKAPMPTARSLLGSISLDGKIYAIGGYNNKNIELNINEVYDPKTDTWQKKAPMPTARDGLGLAVVDGKIYAIGGLNKNGPLSTDEVYDPKTDTWQKKAPMPTARNNLVVFLLKNKIYAIGGWNGKNLNINEVYTPKNNNWQKTTLMPTPRVFFSSATIGNKSYLIGGYNGTSDLVTNEVFSP